MHRTTISLDNQTLKKLSYLAGQTNRTVPNLIQTIIMHHLEDDLYVDDLEMEEIRNDKSLNKSLLRGLADYKAGRGKFVE